MTSPNDELFDRFEALTFDDVVVVPGYSEMLPDAVDTTATFAAGITLAVPLVSAAMDKVTESRMAIAMARQGGIGVIHRNLTIEAQAAEVQKVKRSQSGMITDPVTLPPTATLHDAEALMHRFKFSGVPITDADGRIVGILTNRDIRFCEGRDFDRPVSEFMTSEHLRTAPVGTTLDEAKAILQRYRIEKLPLVDDDGRLAGLITVKDIQKRQEFPNASRDDAGRLRCAAAVGVGDDVEERVEALVARAVDAVAIDTAHGHSAGVIKAIERIKGGWPSLPVVAGNVVTEEGVDALAAGRRRRRQGRCRGRVDLHDPGHQRRRHAAAVGDLADDPPGPPARRAGHRRRRHHVLRRHRQGHRRRRRDRDARLAARRHRGEPGRDGAVRGPPLQELPRHGLDGRHAGPRRRPLRQRQADQSSAVGAATRKLVPEGIEGRVAYAGPLGDVVYQLVGGLRSGMGYAGAAHARVAAQRRPVHAGHDGRPQESHPHDVTITNEAPNYQRT